MGRFRLKSAWRELIDQGPSGDPDADLRVALLALWASGDRRPAVDFLRQSATQRLKSLVGFKEPDMDVPVPEIASSYRKLRRASARAVIEGESEAILSIAKGLPRFKGNQKKANPTKS